MTRHRKIGLLISTALLLVAARVSLAQEAPGALFAASDGKGHVSLLWFPPASKWPAGGWKLSDSTGQVLAPQIGMGDAAALQTLSVEDADAIRKLPAVLATPDTTVKRKQLINIIGLRAFSEPGYARALGLSWTLENVATGSRTYKVEGLDGAGKLTGVQLTSPAVDSSQATPLSPAPGGVQAKVDEHGVSLFWEAPVENRQLPVIAYAVERDGGGQSGAAVTAKPVIPGMKWDAKIPLVLDRNSPPNEMLTYRVFSVDAFGRRSPGTSIRIFYPDFRALEPPDPVTATAGAGKITVNWSARQKPNLAGYVVERGFLYAGPYEALAAQALPPTTAQYEDATVRGGTAYYYRVRAVNSRGDLGNPSSAVMAQPQNSGAPPKVDGLAADTGQTRVRLTWKPVEVPVSGYFVERRALTGSAGVENWVRLNPRVKPEPLYDDYLGLSSDVKMEYRVLAVGFDNAEGPVSASVQVVLADRSLPDAPSIMGSSGADGKAVLNFVPADQKAAQFLVLRSGREGDLGVVIGDPLPGDARQFTDLYVSPGEKYWYRLVAVDKNGNRSDPTRPVAIRVGSPQIPAPAAPTAQFAGTPYPHVVLQFAQPPAGLGVIVERQAGGDSLQSGWLRIAGPMTVQTATDSSVPSGSVGYRISYVSADGRVGPASAAVTVSNPAK
ncbi:MAG: fibronectin type III domain-containing protein [Candidatus Sulfotelmatobacter sp.]